MSDSNSKLVENLLRKPEVHQRWKQHYRTPDNESFYEAAFDYIVGALKPPPGTTFLDAGCGSCAHSVRLAKRGFLVNAVDFSESALEMAAEYVRAHALEDKIRIRRDSLLDLSFSNESFEYVLCWGVLMHIPDVQQAVAELARVVKPGGFVIVSEGNMRSLEAVGVRNLKRLLKREKAEVRSTPAGMEYWKASDGDALVTRQANIEWLISSFEQRGMTLTARVAGQFSEAYAMTSARPIKRIVHGFNNFWFRRIRLPQFAYGNILVLRKK